MFELEDGLALLEADADLATDLTAEETERALQRVVVPSLTVRVGPPVVKSRESPPGVWKGLSE